MFLSILWLGCLWQPLQPYGEKVFCLAHWLGTVLWLFSPRFMCHEVGGAFMQLSKIRYRWRSTHHVNFCHIRFSRHIGFYQYSVQYFIRCSHRLHVSSNLHRFGTANLFTRPHQSYLLAFRFSNSTVTNLGTCTLDPFLSGGKKFIIWPPGGPLQ